MSDFKAHGTAGSVAITSAEPIPYGDDEKNDAYLSVDDGDVNLSKAQTAQ